MFEYFPGNYAWSGAFYLAPMGTGQFRETDRCLARLREAREIQTLGKHELAVSVYELAKHSPSAESVRKWV
jgi:hypothetical protein